MKDGEIARQAEFHRRIAALAQKIAREIGRHGQSDLDALSRAGMEREALLRVLALVIDQEGEKPWADLIRARQEQLYSIVAGA